MEMLNYYHGVKKLQFFTSGELFLKKTFFLSNVNVCQIFLVFYEMQFYCYNLNEGVLKLVFDTFKVN